MKIIRVYFLGIRWSVIYSCFPGKLDPHLGTADLLDHANYAMNIIVVHFKSYVIVRVGYWIQFNYIRSVAEK